MVTRKFCDSCNKDVTKDMVVYTLQLKANTSPVVNTERELCKACAEEVRLSVTPKTVSDGERKEE